ncbi:MAG: hypothetical protein QOJ64_3043 [Acidobacteriota bacterium]|nr:hypothetical protein [Acidobacteriota bacterium]
MFQRVSKRFWQARTRALSSSGSDSFFTSLTSSDAGNTACIPKDRSVVRISYESIRLLSRYHTPLQELSRI